MKIRATPGAALLLLVMAFSDLTMLFATLFCVLVHECGHLLAARLLRVRFRLLELDVAGARLVTAGLIPSYRTEWLVAAAGPLCSLLLVLVLLPHSGRFAALALTTTLSLALFNLLPIEGFDGGRMLAAPLAHLWGENAARSAVRISSYLALLLLFSLSACLLLRYGENVMLAVLSASLFIRLFLAQQG